MNLKPLRGYVLVEAIDDTETTASGLVLPESAKDKPCKGKVLAVGDMTLEWIEFMFNTEKLDMVKKGAEFIEEFGYIDCKVGDKVVYKRWSTTDLEEEGKKLSFVAFQDILGVYTDD